MPVAHIVAEAAGLPQWMATAPSTAAPAVASNNANRIMPAPYRRGVTRIGMQAGSAGGVRWRQLQIDQIRGGVRVDAGISSKTTVCWVPSKVRTSPPSCLANAMPALHTGWLGHAWSTPRAPAVIPGRHHVRAAGRRCGPEGAGVQRRVSGESAVIHEWCDLPHTAVFIDSGCPVGDRRSSTQLIAVSASFELS